MISQLAGQGVAVYGIKPPRQTGRGHELAAPTLATPYIAVGADLDARASLDWGVTGVPGNISSSMPMA